MIQLDDIEVGMRVKIVNSWREDCYENDEGAMDCWLGKELTVESLGKDRAGNPYFIAAEDDGEWCWYLPSIDYIIEDERAIFSPATDISLLYGGV